MITLQQLPNPGLYARVWRAALSARADPVPRYRLGWAGPELDGPNIRRAFWRAMDRRINLRTGPEPTGRRYDSDYQRALYQDQHDLQQCMQHRIRPGIRRWRTDIVQRRYGHLLGWETD